MRNKWWKCQISNKNPLIRKKVFTLAWGGFWLKGLIWIMGDGNALCEQISPSASKKSCNFALWDGITWLAVDWSSSTAFELLVCPSEMPEQICHQKSIYNSLTRLCSRTAAFTSESNDSINYVSARSEAQYIFHIWKLLYSVAYPLR